MLAGNVKLKSFLLVAGLVSAVVFGVVAGGMVLLGIKTANEPPPPPPPVVVQQAAPPVSAAPAATPAAATPPPVAAPPTATGPVAPADRPWDKAVFDRLGQSLPGGKIKDATKGRPYKVNLYQDDGKPSMNRAKVDLDRDEKWDEKYSVDESGHLSRQVAPADDEQYTQTWVWDGAAWVQE